MDQVPHDGVVPEYQSPENLLKSYFHFFRYPKHSKAWEGQPILIRFNWGFSNRATMKQALYAIADLVKGMKAGGPDTSEICWFKMSPFAAKNDHVVMTFCSYYETQEVVDAQRTPAGDAMTSKPQLFSKEQVRRDFRKVCELLKPYDDLGLISHRRQAFQTATDDCPYITFTTYYGASSGSNLAEAITDTDANLGSLTATMLPPEFADWDRPGIAETPQYAAMSMALFVNAWKYCNGPSEALGWDWKYPSRSLNMDWHSDHQGPNYTKGQTQFFQKCVKAWLNTIVPQQNSG
jgi:hypothetical protein